MGDGKAWYLTKAGRAEFAAKVAIRDENPYARVHRLAEEEKQKKLAAADGWWKDAYKWIGFEVDHDPTMELTVKIISMQCPNYDEARRAFETDEHAEWNKRWPSQWLDELAEKARLLAVEIEWINIRDRARKQRKVSAKTLELEPA